jgi:hypothetical protein
VAALKSPVRRGKYTADLTREQSRNVSKKLHPTGHPELVGVAETRKCGGCGLTANVGGRLYCSTLSSDLGALLKHGASKVRPSWRACDRWQA